MGAEGKSKFWCFHIGDGLGSLYLSKRYIWVSSGASHSLTISSTGGCICVKEPFSTPLQPSSSPSQKVSLFLSSLTQAQDHDRTTFSPSHSSLPKHVFSTFSSSYLLPPSPSPHHPRPIPQIPSQTNPFSLLTPPLSPLKPLIRTNTLPNHTNQLRKRRANPAAREQIQTFPHSKPASQPPFPILSTLSLSLFQLSLCGLAAVGHGIGRLFGWGGEG